MDISKEGLTLAAGPVACCSVVQGSAESEVHQSMRWFANILYQCLEWDPTAMVTKYSRALCSP